MARSLLLAPNSAAAAAWLAGRIEDGEVMPGDVAQGLHAFAAGLAAPAVPLSGPLAALLAHTAAARAGLPLAPSDGVALAAVLSELHASSASPADVAAAGRGSALEGHALRLSRAFAAQRELLAEIGRIDPGEVAAIAGRRLREGRELPFDAVVIQPREGWTQGELDLCAALARRGTQVTLELPFDPRRPDLFAPLEVVHQELHREGAVGERAVDPADQASPELRERLTRLFVPQDGAESVPSPSPVAAVTLPTDEAEAREVALRVRKLLCAGAAPDRIALAGSAGARGAAARTLAAARIAVAEGSPRSLAETLPGRAALSLLDLAEGGIEREPLCRLLLAGLLPLGGRPGQRSRGRALSQALREAGGLDHASGTLLPPLLAHVERKEQRLRELARELERAVAVISALPPAGAAAGQASALWAALGELGITSALLAGPPPEIRDEGGEGRARAQIAAAESAAALDRLGKLLSELAALPRALRIDPSRSAFLALLRAALVREPAPAGRSAASGVWLCEPSALAGRSFDHVFLLGLADAEVDRGGDALLPAALREALCRRLGRPACLRPSGRAALVRQQRLAFYLACCSARVSLTGSAARLDGRGRPAEPSAQLRELARASGLDEPLSLDRPILPIGELCLSRAEAVWAHAEEPDVTRAEPEQAAWAGETRDRERRRHLAIREARADPTSGGLLSAEDAELGETLRARLFGRPLSPKLLSLLANCGFRALCEVVLRLGPRAERDEQLDPRESGNVRHRCLRDGFLALARSGLLPLAGGDRRERELEVFLGAARAALDGYESEEPVGHPLVWAAERRAIERQLRRLYGRELEDPGWLPTWFELPFAPGGGPVGQLSLFAPAEDLASLRPPLSIDLPGGSVLLGGRLDRVDRSVAPGRLRIIDYKSSGLGTHVRRLARGFGESELQLAVYALLARHGLAAGGAVDAAYVSIADAELNGSIAALAGKQGIDLDLFLAVDPASRERCRAEGLPNLAERIGELVAGASRGELPVTPGDCRGCDYASACRVGGYYEEWE
ncbi:MAG: PD-(D/E)XK nuclease family protein [Myxococcales bacterium]